MPKGTRTPRSATTHRPGLRLTVRPSGQKRPAQDVAEPLLELFGGPSPLASPATYAFPAGSPGPLQVVGCLILAYPKAVTNPFFLLMPSWALLPWSCWRPSRP